MKRVTFNNIHIRNTIISKTKYSFENALKLFLIRFARQYWNRIHELTKIKHNNLHDRFVDSYTLYVRLYPKKSKRIERIIKKDYILFQNIFIHQINQSDDQSQYEDAYINLIHMYSIYQNYPLSTLFTNNINEISPSVSLSLSLENS